MYEKIIVNNIYSTSASQKSVLKFQVQNVRKYIHNTKRFLHNTSTAQSQWVYFVKENEKIGVDTSCLLKFRL